MRALDFMKIISVWDPPKSTPSHKLLWAILERSLLDLCCGYPPKSYQDKNFYTKTLKREALSWFLSPSILPFSFSWICDHLNLDKKAVKKVVYKINKKEPYEPCLNFLAVYRNNGARRICCNSPLESPTFRRKSI